MARPRTAIVLVILATVAAASVRAEPLRWHYAGGSRGDGEGTIEFQRWQRGDVIVHREIRAGRLVLERRCDGTTYESFDVQLRHRVVRTGFAPGDCGSWAAGFREPGPLASGTNPEPDASPDQPPPRPQTDDWSVETYRRLSDVDAAAAIGVDRLPAEIAGFRLETAFRFVPWTGAPASYVIWRDAIGRELQVVVEGRRMRITAPDARTTATARIALRN
jgi:hypothetical protein